MSQYFSGIPTATTTTLDPSSDICPVCKSNRYLNPNLNFLINSECYHTMCTSCVDRIFTSGPAPCPVAGCHRTLRKRGFHKAFFADLGVEREVDVRKRVGMVFNRRQDDFVGLKEWNDYLEETESLVFELVNGTEKDRKLAEERLNSYREANLREIHDNLKVAKEAADEERKRETAQLQLLRRRRERVARETEEQRMMVERTRNDVLDLLTATSGDPEKVAQQAQKVNARRQNALLEDSATVRIEPAVGALSIRGLKQRPETTVEKIYDPFAGLDLTPSRYVLQQGYTNEWLNAARVDTRHMAGGYSLEEYYGRTMFEAFSGLGILVGNEMNGTLSESGT